MSRYSNASTDVQQRAQAEQKARAAGVALSELEVKCRELETQVWSRPKRALTPTGGFLSSLALPARIAQLAVLFFLHVAANVDMHFSGFVSNVGLIHALVIRRKPPPDASRGSSAITTRTASLFRQPIPLPSRDEWTTKCSRERREHSSWRAGSSAAACLTKRLTGVGGGEGGCGGVGIRKRVL